MNLAVIVWCLTTGLIHKGPYVAPTLKILKKSILVMVSEVHEALTDKYVIDCNRSKSFSAHAVVWVNRPPTLKEYLYIDLLEQK